jgi:hypothetical protein
MLKITIDEEIGGQKEDQKVKGLGPSREENAIRRDLFEFCC